MDISIGIHLLNNQVWGTMTHVMVSAIHDNMNIIMLYLCLTESHLLSPRNAS